MNDKAVEAAAIAIRREAIRSSEHPSKADVDFAEVIVEAAAPHIERAFVDRLTEGLAAIYGAEWAAEFRRHLKKLIDEREG